MSSTAKTIAFLRNLTFDGCLSSGEVWLLAKFLNENEDCQESWPGTILFPALHRAFADKELTTEEMNHLASEIARIEEEWLTRVSSSEEHDEHPPAHLPLLVKPQMPGVNVTVEVPSRSKKEIYNVGLNEHTCTCPEWESRRTWPAGHPGRCCKHIAYAFVTSGIVVEPWFQALLDDCFNRGSGTDPKDDWILLSLPDQKPILVSGASNDWSIVFAPGANGYERFGFSRSQNRWSYGTGPREARHIAIVIHEAFPVQSPIPS